MTVQTYFALMTNILEKKRNANVPVLSSKMWVDLYTGSSYTGGQIRCVFVLKIFTVC